MKNVYMSKLLSIIFFAVIVLSLTVCGGTGGTTDKTDTTDKDDDNKYFPPSSFPPTTL